MKILDKQVWSILQSDERGSFYFFKGRKRDEGGSDNQKNIFLAQFIERSILNMDPDAHD